MQPSPYIFPLLLATFVASALAYFIWQRRPAPGATALTFVFLGEAFWSLCDTLRWASADVSAQIAFAKLRFLGTEIVAIAYFIFAFQYTRRVGQITRRQLTWLALVPYVSLIGVWTNELHHLFFANIQPAFVGSYLALDITFGPWFWLHTAYDYLLLSTGIFLFFLAFVRSPSLYRWQLLTVLLTTLLPLLSNALYLLRASPFPLLDLTPLGFIIGGPPLALGLFHFRVLDIVPAARDAVIESMGEAVIVLDTRDRIVDLNPAAQRILGQPASHLIGQPVSEVLKDFPIPRDHAQVEDEIQSEISIGVNNETRHYDMRLSPLRDRGQINGHLVILYDVTERLKTESELRQTQQNTKTILESIGDAYFEADLEGVLTYVNPPFSEPLGYKPEEVVGKNFRHFTDPESIRRTFEIFNTVYRTGQTYHAMEYMMKRRDNRVGYAEATISLIRDGNGKPLGFRGIMRDITDRKLAEEAIQKARDAAEHELEIGRQIQAGFLPDALPTLDGWEIAAYFRPAREVAGDFYDAFTLSNGRRVGFVVADVCDKGVGAALFMALFRSLFRALADQNYSTNLVDLLTDPNVQTELAGAPSRKKRAMLSTGTNALKNTIVLTNNYIATVHGKSNMFATVFFAVLDPATGELVYINAGHEEPVIVGANGVKARLNPTGPAVGMMPDMEFRIEEVSLDPGDVLLAFTDGVTDARSPDGKGFGEDRLLSLVQVPTPTADALLQSIESELRAHIAGANQFDDITLLAFRRIPIAQTKPEDDEGEFKNELTLDARLENLPAFHQFVVEACIHAGADKNTLYALKLGVDEAVTNLIQYAYADRDAPGVIHLVSRADAENLAIIVTDFGKPFPPDKAPPPDLTSDWQERPIGGLGLYLVKQLMDQVKYESNGANGNRLTLVKRLKS